jgi:hypothetical protein
MIITLGLGSLATDDDAEVSRSLPLPLTCDAASFPTSVCVIFLVVALLGSAFFALLQSRAPLALDLLTGSVFWAGSFCRGSTLTFSVGCFFGTAGVAALAADFKADVVGALGFPLGFTSYYTI